ncbi:hypothetical protein [Pelagibacterium sp.]|uniref:hypothetical protein n=1 Tax=Pelagibacterium sp. TaxID=1967288 RepID=UPI003A90DC5C
MSFPTPNLPKDPWARRCRDLLPPERTFADEMRSPIAREILASLLHDDDEQARMAVEGVRT